MHCSNKFLQNYITLYDLFIFEKKIIFIILNGMYIFFLLFKHIRMSNFKQEIYKYKMFSHILKLFQNASSILSI